MTVAQAIEILKGLPQDSILVYPDKSYDNLGPIEVSKIDAYVAWTSTRTIQGLWIKEDHVKVIVRGEHE